VIVLPRTDGARAQAVAERLRRAIEEINSFLHPVTGSFGVATLRFDMTTRQELIEAADQALYQAKWNGRNRVEAWGCPFLYKAA
ncbi:MAG: diguanylate cyclase, partial [Fimbriimonadales bacterium]|nr:diguanylate cyclase [Fimbriimonadales bacterium]